MPEAEYRHCPVCDQDKPAEGFYGDRSKASGYSSRCKPCDNERRGRYPATPRKPIDPIPDRECVTCGETYTPHRKDQRHCSKACHDPRGPLVTVDCAHCGEPTEKAVKELGRYPTSYCGRGCSSRARWQKGTAIVGPVPRREVVAGPCHPATARPCTRAWVSGRCAECGEHFISNRRSDTYCTTPCAKRSARRRGKWARSKRIHEAAQRERVGLVTIAKRDGWRCHICKRKVSREDWSLDHLIPLSAGGDHTYANVALAHHRCNTLRGASGHAQLRLAA